MIGELLLKEIKTNSFLAKKGIIKKIIALVSSLILLALFVSLEVILYINIFDKINVYSGLNDALFIIISFVLFIFGVISSVNLFYGAFFKNTKEKIILGVTPSSTYDVIFAKSINIYFKLLIFVFSTIFALSVAYGVKGEREFLFHVLMFFSCLGIAFLCETLGMILVLPFGELRKLISRFKVASFIFMLLFLLVAAFLYGAILNLFVNLIRNDDIGSLFTTERVELLRNISSYLYPINSFVEFSKLNEMNVNFIIILAFVVFAFVLGIFLLNHYLTSFYQGKLDKNLRKSNSTFSIKLTSINGALIQKELSLALSNSDGIFSYISLIILQPFLVFSVISAVNLIFSTGNLNYISSLFPSIFLTVDTILIMLFLSVINTTTSMSLIKEQSTLVLMKTMPVSYFKQLLIKVAVPSLISLFSYLVTLIILVSFGEVSWIEFLFLLLVGTLSIALLNIFSLFNDLKSKSASSFLSLLIGFVFPLVSVALGMALSLLVDPEFEVYVFFSSIILLELILLSFFLINIKRRVTNLFMKYEGEAR